MWSSLTVTADTQALDSEMSPTYAPLHPALLQNKMSALLQSSSGQAVTPLSLPLSLTHT